MKTCLKYAAAASLMLLCACRKDATEQMLDRLDEVIASKELYGKRFDREVDSLRVTLRDAPNDSLRWVAANRLFESYITYNIDTAARYVGQMYDYAAAVGDRRLQFLSNTSDIAVLISRNNIHEAYERVLAIDTTAIDRMMRASYYTRKMSVYSRLAEGDDSAPRRAAYADTLSRIRRVRMDFPGHSHITRRRMRALELMNEGLYDDALGVLLPLYETGRNHRTRARIAYNIANAYEALGDRVRCKYWLASAACSDLQTPVREYLSLYRLALMMFEDKDMERAARYIQCTTADVLSCNYNTRIFQSSQAEMIINQAVVYSINSRSRILTATVVLFLILFAIIVLLLFHTLGQHRKVQRINAIISRVNGQLHERNEELSALNGQFRLLNDRLRDANKIKDSYVFRYMDLSARYIGHVDSYRHELRRTARAEGPEAVIAKLRAPSNVDREYRDFYRIFDETFLGIFPDFVERVNELLEPSARFPVRDDRTLPTELRILAAIRLGITDSGRIASFLNCAAPTVYTYRTKLRNSALCPRAEFETRIRDIGL